MKRFFSFTALAVAGIALLAACGADVPATGDEGGGGSADKGTFVGQITIGPACPVEPCDLPEGTIYEGRVLTFLRSGASPFKVALNVDGSFSINLVPADYIIGMENCSYFGCEIFPLEQTIVAGETVTFNRDFDTGIRSPSQNAGLARIMADFTNAGLGAVGVGDVVEQPFFEPQGKTLIVNGESIQIFSFASLELADAAAAQVAFDGGSVGTSMVMWMAPPHFYRYELAAPESVIALYVGSEPSVLRMLDNVAGSQFAGAAIDPTILEQSDITSTSIIPTGDDPQAQMEAYLALMLDLRDALANVGDPDGPSGVAGEATAIANEIATYTPFLQNLSPRVLGSLVEFYGEQMQAVNAEVAEHAARLVTMTGTEELQAALLKGPAFALVDSSISPLRQVDGSVDPVESTEETVGSGMLILPGEETGDGSSDMIVELVP
jgi:hypothetical protein